MPLFFTASTAGLPESLAMETMETMGLLLRRLSCFLAGGERDRLSKRLDLFFSGAASWSKRERFAERRSVSSIFAKFSLV